MKVMIAAIVALGMSAPEHSFEKKLKEAKCTLTEAVEKAGKDLKDVQPISAKLKQIKGKYLWDVRVAQGEKSFRRVLDAKSVEIVEKKNLKSNHAALLASAKVSLAKGIEIALKKVPGKPVTAEMEVENGKPVIEVKVLADGKVFEVEVDAVSGAVLEVEEDDDEDDDDDDDAEDGDDD
ncbi:MAG TPA: PepSY domain-containing protein [Planctomycetota bacterium]